MSTFTAWAARYREALSDRLGLQVEQLESGALLVHHDLRFLIGNYAENDPEFLEVTAAFSIDDLDGDVAERLSIMVSRRLKGAMVLPTDRGILVSLGFPVAPTNCLPDPDHLAAVLPRVFSMIRHAVREFQTAHALHGLEHSVPNVDRAGDDVT